VERLRKKASINKALFLFPIPLEAAAVEAHPQFEEMAKAPLFRVNTIDVDHHPMDGLLSAPLAPRPCLLAFRGE